MSTRTSCDFPECGKRAVWKVELSDISPSPWYFGDASSFTISSGRSPRRSMDLCAKHLPRVTFDLDEIAAFEREKSA